MTRIGGPTSRGLGASASRGAAVTVGSQLIRVGVQLAGIVVLARLLTPSDYGLVAMVTAIIGLGEVVREFGLSSAAIQARSVSRHQRDNLFWINTAIGLGLTLLVYAGSGLIAQLYDDDRLQPLAAVLSITFLLNGISTQYRAGLTRSLSFLGLSGAELVGQVAGLALGIASALLGLGYWALAVQQVGQAFFTLIFLVIAGRWLPGWIHRDAPTRAFLGYGASVFGSQLLGYAARNADAVIIGARFGPFDLGLYNRAFQLMMLPIVQIQAPSTRVALPILSRLQDERDRFAAFVDRGQVALLTVVGATFAFLGAQADSFIDLALGSQWADAVPLFRILLIAGFFQAANYAVYWVFLAKGLTRSNFHYALATRPLMIALIVVGSFWGVYGVAVAYSAGVVLTWPVALIWIAKVSDAPALRMFLNGTRMLIAFGAATFVSFAATLWLPQDADVVRLAVGLAALLLTVALIAVVWPRFRSDLKGLAQTRQYFRRTRAESTEPDEEHADD